MINYHPNEVEDSHRDTLRLLDINREHAYISSALGSIC